MRSVYADAMEIEIRKLGVGAQPSRDARSSGFRGQTPDISKLAEID
jgi:hypothetical protein